MEVAQQSPGTVVDYHHLGATKHHRRGPCRKWALNGKEQVFFELSAHELNVPHTFLMNKMQLELQPSSTLTLAENSAFLNEMLAHKKNDILDFLDKGTRHPAWEPMSFLGSRNMPPSLRLLWDSCHKQSYMQESSPSLEHHPGHSDSSPRQSVASSTIH